MLLVLTAIAVQAAVPELKVAPVPGKGYLITTASFPDTVLDEMTRRQDALAARQCGKLKVRYGRFKYETDIVQAQTWIKNYQQRFVCFDPANDPYFPAPANWKAQPGDDAAALAFAKRYMATVDANDAKAGLAMLEPDMELTPAEWSTFPAGWSKLRGAGTRTYGAPEWANNPKDAAHPGAYATVHFRGDFANMAAHCGVLFLYRRGPNDYQVSQQNFRAITRSDVAAGKMSAADVKAACG